MQALKNAIDKVLDFILGICSILLAASVILYFINCMMRYLFKAPIPWPEEFCIYSMVLIIFYLQCMHQFRDTDLKIEVIDNMIKDSIIAQRIIFIIREIITLVVFVTLFKTGLDVAAQNFQYGGISPIIQFSLGGYYTLINISFILVIICTVVNIFAKQFKREDAAA